MVQPNRFVGGRFRLGLLRRRFAVLSGLALAIAPAALGQQTRPPTYDLRAQRGAVLAIAWSPDGTQIAGAYADNHLRIWNVREQRITCASPVRSAVVDGGLGSSAGSARIESIAWSGAGGFLAEAFSAAPGGGVVRLWKPEDCTRIRVLAEGIGNLRALDVSADGKLVALNTPDRERSGHRIALLNPADGAELGTLRGERLSVSGLRFSRDGRVLASFAGSKAALWDVAGRKLLREFTTPAKTILAVAISDDGKRFAAGGADEKLRIWNVEDGAIVREITHKSDQILALAFSRSGRTLASGGADSAVRLWSLEFGHQREMLLFLRDRAVDLKFSPDGALLAAGSRDESIAVWDFAEPEKETPPKEDPNAADAAKKPKKFR